MADFSDYEGDENIIEHYENQESGNERDSHGEEQDATSDNEMGAARRIHPSTSKSKSHVVRNPVPKLNTERLKGPNGILALENYFEGFKFYGKGHEKTDLERIMKRLQHWSYRLFPKFHFDDFLTRVEQLGMKKDMQVFIKKYRTDMITSDNNSNTNDIVDKDDEDEEQESAPLDDFDLLITEQIQKQKRAETRASVVASSEDAFDKLLTQSSNVQNSQTGNTNTVANTDANTDVNIEVNTNASNINTNTNASMANELKDEIKQKIERNKQLAIQRRLQRHKEYEEKIKRTKLIDDKAMEIINESKEISTQADNMQSQVNENANEATVIKAEDTLSKE
ncbi:hypothetical protein PUN28_009694 [Cardiocondyla obscurior]|uniref:TIMELESS-interacting protein n=1 Tax=Cardiocondyla obscurior TaxID=286306 RepID=A0AAW2FTJ6_9HYME